MVKVTLNKTVKYAGAWHPANTVFEIEEKHLEEYKLLGAAVVESSKKTPTEPIENEPVVQEPIVEDEPTEDENIESEEEAIENNDDEIIEEKVEEPKTDNKRKATRKRG